MIMLQSDNNNLNSFPLQKILVIMVNCINLPHSERLFL